MIARLRGIIIEKQLPLILVETGGISYEIHMPVTCFHKLPNIGHEVMIFTHLIVRDDMQLLFGFNSKQERILFRELIKTNGVGPKLALVILSSLSISQFILAMKNADPTILIKLPGIGKKTAERIILEMKDRFKRLHNELFGMDNDPKLSSPESSDIINTKQEAIAALVTLGYKYQEANRMVSKVVILDNNTATIVREALRYAL